MMITEVQKLISETTDKSEFHLHAHSCTIPAMIYMQAVAQDIKMPQHQRS